MTRAAKNPGYFVPNDLLGNDRNRICFRSIAYLKGEKGENEIRDSKEIHQF